MAAFEKKILQWHPLVSNWISASVSTGLIFNTCRKQCRYFFFSFDIGVGDGSCQKKLGTPCCRFSHQAKPGPAFLPQIQWWWGSQKGHNTHTRFGILEPGRNINPSRPTSLLHLTTREVGYMHPKHLVFSPSPHIRKCRRQLLQNRASSMYWG